MILFNTYSKISAIKDHENHQLIPVGENGRYDKDDGDDDDGDDDDADDDDDDDSKFLICYFHEVGPWFVKDV